MDGWIVARTQYNREAWAAENILRQGAEPYLPKYAALTKVAGRFVMRGKLLFPTYIFVKCLEGRWRFLLGTFGVSNVMLVGSGPAIVHDAEVNKIRALQDADGLVILPKLKVGFKPGDSVRVTEGPYSGYVGIHDGQVAKDRERILLEYLGRKTPVLIDTAQLVAK